MDFTRDNAIRLAGVLARYAEDERAVRMLAQALNYYPDQLRRDMAAVLPYLRRLEREVLQDGDDI